MKVLFREMRSLVRPMVVALLGIALSVSAHAQDNPQVSYGLHLGFTENKVDLYSTQSGETQAMESFLTPGFRIAVIGEAPLSSSFSLRMMPGMSVFSSKWEPNNFDATALPSTGYKVESILGELPVDVKFHVRIGKVEPYVAFGLNYRFDFSSMRKDDDGSLQPLNVQDLHYTTAWGVDWYTRYLKVGFEIRINKRILSPGSGGSDLFYFRNGSSFSLGVNFEA